MKKIIFTAIFLSTLLPGVGYSQLNKDYFFWAGRSYLSDSKYEEAIKTINIILKADPESYEGYLLRGIAKYNLDDLLGARQDFSTAIEINPVYTLAYQYRAIAQARIGNYDDALSDFQETLALRPDRASPYYSRGVTYLLNRQFEKAIADFNRFILMEGKMVEAYVNRGTAYLHLNDTIRAIENYNMAIRTNRDDPRGYYVRGQLRMQQEDYGSALEDFDQAITADTTYIPAYFGRAILYANTKKPMFSLADFDKVLSLDSTNSVTYFNRAIVRTQIGDYNRALDDYDKVALYSPDNVLVYYNRAGLQARLGNLAAAARDYSRAIELYPDFANAYLFRSELKYFMRDFEGAIRDKATAEAKIAEYRSRVSDSTFAIYADTSQRFSRLLTFDTGLSRRRFEDIAPGSGVSMRPMFRFTLVKPDSVHEYNPHRYWVQRIEDFRKEMDTPWLDITNRDSDVPADSVMAMDRRLAASVATGDQGWHTLMLRGITQSLIKQYTNSVNTYMSAIERDPTNPFLYINLSATRAEMIDFISSIDNSYQNIVIDSDPANRLKNSQTRTYSYDEPIVDLNKAAKLMPDCAYIYYNRGNLRAISGQLPEACEDYTKAIELNPYFADAYFNRGLVQIYLKDTAKGSFDMSKAGELGISEAYDVLKIYVNNE